MQTRTELSDQLDPSAGFARDGEHLNGFAYPAMSRFDRQPMLSNEPPTFSRQETFRGRANDSHLSRIARLRLYTCEAQNWALDLQAAVSGLCEHL